MQANYKPMLSSTLEIQSLRDILSQRLLPNFNAQPMFLALGRKNGNEKTTKEKKPAAGHSLLNKMITERSTSKKKNAIQIQYCQQKADAKDGPSSLFQQPSAVVHPAGLRTNNQNTSFFGNFEKNNEGQPFSSGQGPFFGKAAGAKKEGIDLRYLGNDPFASSTANLMNSLKPKKLKITLNQAKGTFREETLYRDTDLGLACSMQIQPKGMVGPSHLVRMRRLPV